jgi:hypothetical protein
LCATRGLHDIVQRHKLGDHDLSHDSFRLEQQLQAFNCIPHLTYRAGRFGGLRLPQLLSA